MTTQEIDRFFKRLGYKVKRGSYRGNVYKVLSDWRGILDWTTPHAFYLSNEEGGVAIRYPLRLDIQSVGGVSEGWMQVGRQKPELYSQFLKRHGWKQFADREAMFEGLTR